MSDASPLARIARAELTSAEQRVVDYLLGSSDVLISGMTASDLAQRTGTSRSTVDRLAKRLGFSGMRELRLALLHESRSLGRPISETAGERAIEPKLEPDDGLGEVAYKVFHSTAIRAMRFAEMLAGAPELDKLVAAFERAAHVEVFGAGASAVVGRDLHQRLLRLGLPINFAEDHHQQIALAALMRPGDLAIAISYSGRTRTTLQAARVAQQQGATIAAVVGVPNSPLDIEADITILTPPGVSLFGTDAVMTRILEMMFNEVLFHCLVLRHPEMRGNVARIEALLSDERS